MNLINVFSFVSYQSLHITYCYAMKSKRIKKDHLRKHDNIISKDSNSKLGLEFVHSNIISPKRFGQNSIWNGRV